MDAGDTSELLALELLLRCPRPPGRVHGYVGRIGRRSCEAVNAGKKGLLTRPGPRVGAETLLAPPPGTS
ncbi:hypothetical protein NDU88_001979 [Pleurodeles waltl]|uniref:Uncharacterized protein n=1 Tax=Pleurodeles waltl TaxID=8319 RepID=A0AAV7W1K1_PLEWA|nr:hypothetical protein NDU88_001979 [Pleurodeles waltl]